MADRLRFSRQEVGALTGFGLLLLVTASWWALAFWPTGQESLLARTREVCFGAKGDGLPDGAGWLALVLQPAIMFALFLLILRQPFEGGLRRLLAHRGGLAATGLVTLLVFSGLTAVGVRVASAAGDPEVAAANGNGVGTVAVGREAPGVDLVDQYGDLVAVETFRGKPLLVTFGFGHCETVCPAVVRDAMMARDSLARLDQQVGLLVVTLDPWRDILSRLPTIAASWGLDDGRLVSGPVARVERVLDSWRVPRARDPRTGDIVHQRLTYLVDSNGVIEFATDGTAWEIVSLAQSMVPSDGDSLPEL